MTATKKRILAAVLAVVIIAGIVLTIYFTTKKTVASAETDTNAIYSLADVEAAREEGYAEGVGDKAKYEATIKRLQETIIENERIAKEKYDAMVAYYEAEIKRLTDELTRKIEYAKQLETYLIDLTIELADPSNSMSALGLQLAAYRTIESNILLDIGHWTQTYNNLPDLTASKQVINDCIAQIDEAEKALKNAENAMKVYDLINWIVTDSSNVFIEYLSLQHYRIVFHEYTFTSEYITQNQSTGINVQVFKLSNSKLKKIFYDLNIDSFIDSFGNTWVNDITGKTGVNLFSTLLNNYLHDYWYYDHYGDILYIATRDTSGYVSEMQWMSEVKNSYSGTWARFLYERTAHLNVINEKNNKLTSLSNTYSTTKTYVDEITQQKTIAEYILSTSASSLITVRQRIAEIENQIQLLESEVQS